MNNPPGHTANSLYTLSAQATHAATLEKWANAVLLDGQNLLIWSCPESLAATPGQALQAWWQALAPQIRIHDFSGQDRLTWLGHVNQMLSRENLLQMADLDNKRTLAQDIGLIHDADQLKPEDLQLLQRLSQHMPGWPMRWVLLFKGAQPLPGDPASPLALCKELQPAWLNCDVRAAPPTAPNPMEPSRTDHGRTQKAWLIGLLCLIGLASGAVWVLSAQPVATTGAPSWPSKPGTAKPDPASPVATASEPGVQPPSVEGLPTAKAPAKAQEVPVTPAASQASPLTLTLPEVAVRGHRWLAELSPSFFLLEHGAFEQPQQAQSLIRSQAELANARVIMAKTKDQAAPRFLVVTGPFRSEDRAQNFKIRNHFPEKVRLRSVADVLKERVTSNAP